MSSTVFADERYITEN